MLLSQSVESVPRVPSSRAAHIPYGSMSTNRCDPHGKQQVLPREHAYDDRSQCRLAPPCVGPCIPRISSTFLEIFDQVFFLFHRMYVHPSIVLCPQWPGVAAGLERPLSFWPTSMLFLAIYGYNPPVECSFSSIPRSLICITDYGVL